MPGDGSVGGSGGARGAARLRHPCAIQGSPDVGSDISGRSATRSFAALPSAGGPDSTSPDVRLPTGPADPSDVETSPALDSHPTSRPGRASDCG